MQLQICADWNWLKPLLTPFDAYKFPDKRGTSCHDLDHQVHVQLTYPGFEAVGAEEEAEEHRRVKFHLEPKTSSPRWFVHGDSHKATIPRSQVWPVDHQNCGRFPAANLSESTPSWHKFARLLWYKWGNAQHISTSQAKHCHQSQILLTGFSIEVAGVQRFSSSIHIWKVIGSIEEARMRPT